MNLHDFAIELEKEYPLSAQEEWDHCGFSLGRIEKEITRIYVALDPTLEQIEHAIANRCDLLLTHHPLLFSPCETVTDLDPTGTCVISLLQHDICAYAMHTNYDVLRMNRLAFEKMGIDEMETLSDDGIGMIGIPSKELTPKKLCQLVKDSFSLPRVRFYEAPNTPSKIRKIACVPGSGKSMIDEAIKKGAEVLITGDIGHHDGLYAMESGLSLIDAGHYGVEQIFVEDVTSFLKGRFPECVIFAEETKLPYFVV